MSKTEAFLRMVSEFGRNEVAKWMRASKMEIFSDIEFILLLSYWSTGELSLQGGPLYQAAEITWDKKNFLTSDISEVTFN